MDEVIEVRGKVEFNDLLKFQYFHALRRTWWLVLAAAVAFALILLLMGVAVIGYRRYDVAARNGPLLFLVLVLYCLVFTLLPYLMAKRLQKSQISLGKPMSYSFSQQGIEYQGAYASGKVSWETIWRAYESRSAFFLYLSSASAVVLPKHFFAGTEQQDSWRGLVNRQIAPKVLIKPGLLGGMF